MTMEERPVGSHGSGGLATQDLREVDQGACASVRRSASRSSKIEFDGDSELCLLKLNSSIFTLCESNLAFVTVCLGD